MNGRQQFDTSLLKQEPILEIEAQQHLDKEPPLLGAWDQVQLARHKDRPHTIDYIRMMCKNFFELRGDRR